MMSGKSLPYFALKATISISLLALVCAKIDFSVFNRHLSGAQAASLLLAMLLLLTNILLVAARWWLLLRRLGFTAMPFGSAMLCNYASVVVGQVTPGTVGSDAVRGWLAYRRGAPVGTVVASLIADRLLAVLGIGIVVAIVWLWRLQAPAHVLGLQTAALAAVVLLLGAMVLWLAPDLVERIAKRWPRLRPLHEVYAAFRAAAWSGAGAAGLALSCAIIVLTVNAVILFAGGLGVSVPPSVLYLVVPVVILASAVPISIAGWGLREASIAYGLIMLGAVSQQDAALLGLMLGIGLLLVSLPGGVAMLLLGKEARTAVRQPMPVDQ